MATGTYYFNSKSTSVWTDSAYMIDNILTNYASTASDGDTEVLDGNTCPGTDLGEILKVEIRAYGYGDGDDRIDLTPTFDGSAGDEHQVTMPGSADWGGYVDITNDTNAPSPWTWAAVQTVDVDCEFDKSGKGGTMRCAKVEIRVTYWAPPVSDIDVGAAPLDRANDAYSEVTYIGADNPANDSGTITGIRVYAETNITGFRVGTFYTTNGNTLKCRDSELVGDGTVEAGAERTFGGLSITVVVGDYIGCYFATGNIELSSSGFSGRWYVAGEYIDPNDETAYTFAAGGAISLYGYGDIAAGEEYEETPSTAAGLTSALGSSLDISRIITPLLGFDLEFTKRGSGFRRGVYAAAGLVSEKIMGFARALSTQLGLLAGDVILHIHKTLIIAAGLGEAVKRKVGISRPLSATIGLKLIITRGVSRALTTLLGLVVTVGHICVKIRTISTGLGLVAGTVLRLGGISRTVITEAGLKAGAVKRGMGRTFIALQGLVATVETVVKQAYEEVVSTLLGLASTIKRGVGRTLSTDIGLLSTLARTYGAVRTLTTQLGITPIREAIREFIRILTTEIGLTSALIRGVSKIISTAAGLVPTVTRPFGILRSYTVQEGLRTVVLKGPGRTLSTLIGLKSKIQHEVGKTVSAAVGLASSMIRNLEGTRKVVTILGVTPIREAVREFVRILAVTIGLLTTIARQVKAVRELAATEGLIATLTRGVSRALKTTLGLRSQVARGFTEILSALIGLESAIERLFNKVLSATTGLISTVARQTGIKRILSTLAGLKAVVVEEFLDYTEIITAAIGVVASAARQITLERIVSTGLGLASTLIRGFTKIFSASVGLLAADVRKGVSRIVSTAVGLAPVLTRLIQVTRSLATQIGITPLTEKLGEFIRELVTSLGMLAGAVTRQLEIVRLKSVALGLVSIFTRGPGRILTATVGLVTSKLHTLQKILEVAIGVTPTFEKLAGFGRPLITRIGIAPLSEVVIEFFRILTTALGLVPGISRLVQIVKTESVGLGLLGKRTLELGRTLTVRIGLTATYLRSFVKTLTSAIGLVGTAVALTIGEYVETFTTAIGQRVNVKIAFGKIFSAVQGLVGAVGRTKQSTAAVLTAIGIVAERSRSILANRIASTRIGVTPLAETLIEIKRVLSTAIGLTASVTRNVTLSIAFTVAAGLLSAYVYAAQRVKKVLNLRFTREN